MYFIAAKGIGDRDYLKNIPASDRRRYTRMRRLEILCRKDGEWAYENELRLVESVSHRRKSGHETMLWVKPKRIVLGRNCPYYLKFCVYSLALRLEIDLYELEPGNEAKGTYTEERMHLIDEESIRKRLSKCAFSIVDEYFFTTAHPRKLNCVESIKRRSSKKKPVLNITGKNV